MEIPERPDLASYGEARQQPPEPSARAERVRRAAEVWKGQLVNLGGRHTLLYHKDLKQGTLDIGPESGVPPLVVESLLGAHVRDWTDVERWADSIADPAAFERA